MKATRDAPIESEEAREDLGKSEVEVARAEVVESEVEVAEEVTESVEVAGEVVAESVIERGEVWSGIKGLRMSEMGENRSLIPDRESIGPLMKE